MRSSLQTRRSSHYYTGRAHNTGLGLWRPRERVLYSYERKMSSLNDGQVTSSGYLAATHFQDRPCLVGSTDDSKLEKLTNEHLQMLARQLRVSERPSVFLGGGIARLHIAIFAVRPG